MAAPSLSELPCELISLCLSFLDARERFLCSGVCRAFRKASRLAPHSASLELTVNVDVLSGDAIARLPATVLSSLRGRPLAAGDAQKVLMDPICSQLKRFRLTAVFEGRPSSHVGAVVDALPQTLESPSSHVGSVIDALPPTLESLRITTRRFDGLDDADAFLAQLQLHSKPFAARLRELRLESAVGHHSRLARIGDVLQMLRLPSLELLDADLCNVDAERLLRLLPSLRRIAGVSQGDDPARGAGDLAALAARGLRCHSLHLECLVLGPAAALALALIDPRGFPAGFGAGGSSRDASALHLTDATLPDALPSPDCLAGVESIYVIDCMNLGCAALRWLTGGPHVPTLKRMVFDCSVDCAPRQLLEAVESLPEGVSVEIYVQRGWAVEELVHLFDAAQRSPRLLRDIRICHWGPRLPAPVEAAQERYVAAVEEFTRQQSAAESPAATSPDAAAPSS
eukprot:tig00020684_g12894.t1